MSRCGLTLTCRVVPGFPFDSQVNPGRSDDEGNRKDIESHLKAGNQPVIDGQELTYGQSITDACLSWDDTVPLLKNLARAVQKRRTVDTNRSLNA